MKQASKPTTDHATLRRRQLLGAAGTTGALAGVAALLATRQDAADVAAAETKTTPTPSEGYRETAHVLRYYQTTKV